MKTAIIGCGLIGTKRANAMGSLNIACDLSLESAKKLASKFPGCIATDKLEDVLNSDINVAFVCVSNNQLASIVKLLTPISRISPCSFNSSKALKVSFIGISGFGA